uniref:Trehalase n=1 Tax=Parascaris equorum TaxID=6256 RepID=A0A914S819_PAREQ
MIYCQGELLHAVMMLNIFKDSKTFCRCELVDWQKEPEQLLSIEDPDLRQFALQVVEHPRRHSLIYVPNEFVVPGGRFREFYYWDTY